MPDPKQVTRSVSVGGKFDWHNGICTLTVQDGLKLPVEVNIPFIAIKEMMTSLLIGECRMARGMAPVPSSALIHNTEDRK